MCVSPLLGKSECDDHMCDWQIFNFRLLSVKYVAHIHVAICD